ncbi:MAG: GC-type dockerin domain-anchored protein [Phycisphaerales bacterium JB059]
MPRPTPLALALIASMPAASLAQTDNDVAVDLTGVEIECEFLGPCFPDQIRDSVTSPFPAGPAQYVLPATGYRWTLGGTLDTTFPLSSFIPPGATLEELLDILQPGNSFLTRGYVRYPAGSLTAPDNQIWSEPFSGSFGNDSFTLDLSITIELSLDDQGALSGALKDIDIPTVFLTGSATFTDGFAMLDTWTPSPRQQTEWRFDGDLSSVPGSAAAKLAYLDDPAFGTILGGVGDEDNPHPPPPPRGTPAPSALGITGPGGLEDTVYCTSPARNLTTGNPDHRRGIGLALFPATQPSYPGKFFGQWTMIFDLYIPSEAWYADFPANTTPREFPLALIQGNHNNDNAADTFFRNSGGQMTFGNSSDDFSSDVYKPLPISPDTWFRLALVCDDFTTGKSRVFLDGVYQFETNGDWLYNQVDPNSPTFADGEAIDPGVWASWGEFPSPWALSTGTAPDSQGPSPCSATVCLFADLVGGRSETVYLANMYFADDMLTDSEVTALGGPSAEGIVLTGPLACNAADLAEPFGALDFTDVVAFLTGFGSMDPVADLAPPVGVFDFTDVITFLGAFGAGCP